MTRLLSTGNGTGGSRPIPPPTMPPGDSPVPTAPPPGTQSTTSSQDPADADPGGPSGSDTSTDVSHHPYPENTDNPDRPLESTTNSEPTSSTSGSQSTDADASSVNTASEPPVQSDPASSPVAPGAVTDPASTAEKPTGSTETADAAAQAQGTNTDDTSITDAVDTNVPTTNTSDPAAEPVNPSTSSTTTHAPATQTPAPATASTSAESLPNTQAPEMPGVPAQTHPTVDNSPMSTPQAQAGSPVLEGGSNEGPATGTPPQTIPTVGSSSSATPANDPLADDLILNSSPSKILGDNLIEAGNLPPVDADGVRIPGWQAHHIIPASDKRAQELRDQLIEEWGIDINDATNGVWLPQNAQTQNPNGTTTHNQTFRKEYFDFLTREFDGITSPQAARDKLESIREGLESGALQFNSKPRNISDMEDFVVDYLSESGPNKNQPTFVDATLPEQQ